MFEKEAIIHAFEETIGIECLNKPVEDFTYEELSDELQEKAYDFKKGAEFGYNKAFVEADKNLKAIVTDFNKVNEWHYVKDGDLPKVGQKCYFIYSNYYGEDNKVIFSESSIKVLTGVYTFILDEETGDETTETCFYDDINDEEIYEQEVYAWKEIVLPELPKESE